jgi:phospholipid/cholesterol/gamma-HCH transport system ATP-binding protein
VALDRSEGATLRVLLRGRWALAEGIPPLAPVARAIEADPRVERVALDGSGLEAWDSSLLTFVRAAGASAAARRVPLDASALPEGARRLLDLALAVEPRSQPRAVEDDALTARVGRIALRAWGTAGDALTFLGEAVIALGALLRGRARFRRKDLLHAFEATGVGALGIVALINFLIGAVLAFVGAVQLQPFGATIFVASLVGIGVTRELGALMTGIVMAGRTGASFAATLGTMTVNEEVDALRTCGLRPAEFLVLPRVLATALMMPALVAYADLLGLLGGLLVGVTILDLGDDRVRQPDPGRAAPAPRPRRPRQERGLRRGGRAHRHLLRHPLRPQRGRGGRGGHEGGGDGDRARGGGGRGGHGAAAPPGPLRRSVAEPFIEVRDLTMGYGETVVQRDLSFVVSRGEVFVVMGDSGCGKSTLMRHMVGLARPRSGDVLYDGEGYWAAGEERKEALARRFGVLYQSSALWSSMTLEHNVALPLEEHAGLPSADAREVARLKLALVGLAGFEEHYPSEVSGGMRKRAGIARAIALDPGILYLDEPSAGLDPLSSRRLDDLVLELRDSLGTTVVLVTHELASIFELGSRAVFLDAERRTMTALGTPDELQGEPRPQGEGLPRPGAAVSARAHPRAVGVFVLGALALVLGAVLWLSSGDWFEPKDRFLVAFPGRCGGSTPARRSRSGA